MPQPSVPYLKRGSEGDYVRVVQKIINLHRLRGINQLVPDGKFGPHTEAAVKAFQSRYRLVPDGVVGPLTRAKLFPLGTYQSVICITSPADPVHQRGAVQPGFAPVKLTFGQASPASGGSPPQTPPVISFPSSTTFPLAPMTLGGSVSMDRIPGLPDELPFPDAPSLPSGFPTLPPLIPPLTLPPLPPIFPNKVQLAPGNQLSVPKLTLFGPSPKSNPFVDVFAATVRGVWPIAQNGVLQEIEAGGTLGVPISQPISDPKNTTYQVFVQGVSPDLLIKRKMWFELHVIGKAAVTIPKDGSSTAVAVSAQVKASFPIDDKVSASVVGGPQLTGTVAGGNLSVTVTPLVINAGVTVSF